MSTFLSTSIPYVNARPHIGFAFECVQTDVLARLFRQVGEDVYFTTGSDENALKNIESAEKAGKPVQEFVDDNARVFLELCESLNISNDTFIRTSSPAHMLGAQQLWTRSAKDIYQKTYSGLYCVGCETFYEDGEFPDNICPNHNRKLELVEEENYFFALSRYQTQVEQLLAQDKLTIFPAYRKDELLNFVRKGLQDFSISRPTRRMKGWGVPVPGDDSQRMYVWYDALSNYITALGFGSDDESRYEKYWVNAERRVHVIGKDIIKFHGIYWPAMLMSAGLPLPTHLFTHGFITVDGQKMSKTIGNVIDPFELVKKYGLAATRYYLAREVPVHDDGDYSDHRMRQLYTADLANELGNLLSRSIAIAAKDGITMGPQEASRTTGDQPAFAYQAILTNIWTQVKEINKSLNEFEPWSMDTDSRASFMKETLAKLHQIGLALEPFLPATAEMILQRTQGKIEKIAPLFPRIEI
ncbi:methionine--tRNA ligase [Candidatus Woesebacteria bacterium]|nr:methionine--tRNA ligase [Candidatus Woesebacteria bacterium]